MADVDQIEAARQLAQALFNDPETRPKIEEAIVHKFGDKGRAAIPGYREREMLSKDRDEFRQERDAWRAEREKDKASQELERQRRVILEDPELRIRPDEIEPIEKLMVEETIGSHKAAARLYRQSQAQVASPRGAFSFNAEVPGLEGAGGDYFKGIVENPERWGRERAAEIIRDANAGRIDKWA